MAEPEKITMVELTDVELDALNQVVRSYKITATGQEMLMLKFNKTASPVLDAITKVVMAWERRGIEAKAEQEAALQNKSGIDSKIISLNDLSPESAAQDN